MSFCIPRTVFVASTHVNLLTLEKPTHTNEQDVQVQVRKEANQTPELTTQLQSSLLSRVFK